MHQELTSIEVSVKKSSFSCQFDQISKNLFQVSDLSEESIGMMLPSISLSDDKSFKKSDLITRRIFDDLFEMSVCFYQQASETKLDLICIIGRGIFSARSEEAAQAAWINIYSGMKNKAFSLPQAVLSLTVFQRAKLGSVMQQRLGSKQSQAELDQLIKNSASEKEQAIIDLNKNKNDPFLAKLFKNGLTSYTSSAVIENVEGVEQKMLNQYASFLAGNIGIPSNSRQEFI